VIHESQFVDVAIPDVPITERVLRHASRLADKPALVDGATGRQVTYGELDTAVRSLAGGLVARGRALGEVVGIMAPNVPEYAVVFHGTAMAGGTVTTVNPTYTAAEVHHQLVDAGATMLVTVAAFLDVARAAVVDTRVTEIVVLGADAPDDTVPYASLFGAPLAEHVPVDGGHVVVLPYSSGTTGLSKGVMLTHRNLVANVEQTLAASALEEHDTIDAVLPFFHIYGMQIMMNCALSAGVTVVMLPRFDLAQFLAMHQQYRVTVSFLAPPIVLALAKHPMVNDHDLSSLRWVLSAAAPLSAELGREAAARLGAEVVQGYGMTELSPVSHVTPPGNAKPGSVGVAVPNTQTMIVDPSTGTSLGVDEVGEVWVRGPQVMAGYLNNPGATATTIDDAGWLHTGDLGVVDADGHLFIVDRLKELIKYKGFQVPPAELEALLLTHPAVADAAVIGRPDDEAGEVPVGFVVLKPDADATTDDVLAVVNAQVAHYKQLAELTLVPAIPKSAAGKILRRELRARIA
jgi:acyl-CoA synthetase (AMP-forming)/AMP-acid ligase II